MNRPATKIMEWAHPNIGPIRELLCQPHFKEVLAALKTLGIGCGAEIAKDKPDCTRCAAETRGLKPRQYLRGK